MRSRYSAYARGDGAYLLHSWHPSTRPREVVLDPELRWTQLEIVATDAGGALAQDGTVELRAHYERDGHPGVLHEISRFVRLDRRWVYLDAA
jgi:SEC-C motif domain protein